MSTSLLQSAAGAIRRSIRHRSSLPWLVRPVMENPLLFSSGSAGRKQPNKHTENFYTLKHNKFLMEEEKKLREALAVTRQSINHELEKQSRLLQELELHDKRSEEKYESLKQLMKWTTVSFFALFALYKVEKA